MQIVKIVCGILIPPVAAFLQVGLTAHFWINLILTFCFYLPGQVHALWLVVTDRRS